MATTTYTHGGTANQPFGSASGIKFIDNFVTTAFPTQGPVDPYTGLSMYLVTNVKMYMGGTSGTAGAARLGLWNSAGSYYQVGVQTINGVAATVSSTTALETSPALNAVIVSGRSYYAGGWASASLASKRDTATGSFSSYTGNGTSTTVGTTYNPGNLYFQILYYYLPGAPNAPTVTSKTNTSATISWSLPAGHDNGGTPITGYRVDYSSDGGTNWITWTHGVYSATPATTATITGLKPGGSYIFRVAAKNGVVPGYGINGVDSEVGFYTDASVTWTYDGYSSGPYSPSSASTQLPGGRWNGSVWQPVTPRIVIQGTQTASSLSQGSFTTAASMTLPSVTGIGTNDIIVIRNATNTLFNNTSTNALVTGVTGNTVYYTSSYFNSTGSTITSTSATVEVWRPATIKRYNGSSWSTVM